MWKVALLVLSFVVCGANLWGHPGHGTTDPASPGHLAEPIHAGPVVGGVAAGAAAALLAWKRAGRKRPSR